jgi:hypothetical protein
VGHPAQRRRGGTYGDGFGLRVFRAFVDFPTVFTFRAVAPAPPLLEKF